MAEYEIERVCPVCGKHFDVLYKELWAYKKPRTKGGYDFYCTWTCLREAETNKTKKPEPVPEKRENKDRLAVLKDLMDAISDGRNAHDYLRDMGYADPKDTLRKLRTTAKKDAPEIYQQMEQNGLLDMRKGHSGKGVDKVSKHKLTREQKEKAVEIAIQGGDPLVHLKKCGAKNPTAAWWYIKKTLATKNPQLLEKIPEKIGTVLNEKGQVAARVEVAEKLPPEAVAEVPEADPLAGFQVKHMGKPVAMSREEHKEAHQGSAAITVPVEYDGFKVVNMDAGGTVTELEKTDDGVRFVISVPPEQAEQMDKVLKDIMDPEKDALCMSLHNPPKENRIRYTVMSIKTKAGTFTLNEEERITWVGASCTTLNRKEWEDLAEVLPEVLEILGEDV